MPECMRIMRVTMITTSNNLRRCVKQCAIWKNISIVGRESESVHFYGNRVIRCCMISIIVQLYFHWVGRYC